MNMKPRCPHCGEELGNVVEQDTYEERPVGSVHLEKGAYAREVVTGRLMGDCTKHGLIVLDRKAVR